MDRRDFIKSLVPGGDYRPLLKWALILSVLSLFLFFNTAVSIDNLFAIARIIGFVLVLFVPFFILGVCLYVIVSRLPSRTSDWLRRHGIKIMIALVVGLFAYVIYDLVKQERYTAVVFIIVIFGLRWFLDRPWKTQS